MSEEGSHPSGSYPSLKRSLRHLPIRLGALWGPSYTSPEESGDKPQPVMFFFVLWCNIERILGHKNSRFGNFRSFACRLLEKRFVAEWASGPTYLGGGLEPFGSYEVGAYGYYVTRNRESSGRQTINSVDIGSQSSRRSLMLCGRPRTRLL